MTDEPVKLVTRPQTVRADVVAILEKWLSWAKEGDLESIAICAVLQDREKLMWDISFTRNRGTLLGAMTLMQHDMAENLRRD